MEILPDEIDDVKAATEVTQQSKSSHPPPDPLDLEADREAALSAKWQDAETEELAAKKKYLAAKRRYYKASASAKKQREQELAALGALMQDIFTRFAKYPEDLDRWLSSTVKNFLPDEVAKQYMNPQALEQGKIVWQNLHIENRINKIKAKIKDKQKGKADSSPKNVDQSAT